jgi:ADP-ribosylglycohydrolase
MLGAIIGDIVGSIYEFHNDRHIDVEIMEDHMRFTDDTVLTIATMDALLYTKDYTQSYQHFFDLYVDSHRGFGGMFYQWGIQRLGRPYNSFGNGSAMRVSPVAYVSDDVNTILAEAKRSAEVTHNHPEGIKGAQAIALAVFRARFKTPKKAIKQEIIDRFAYDFSRSIETIRANSVFDETCQGSVPEALTAFFEADSFEDTLRLAISLGGDSDTIACIACGIAEAYYGIPEELVEFALSKLDYRQVRLIEDFYKQHLRINPFTGKRA